MSNPLPNLLALTSIPEGAPRLSAPVRNNYAAIQAAVNTLITALSGGSAGQVLEAVDGTDVRWSDAAQEITGHVTSAGSGDHGSGFTASRSGAGQYTVTFTTAYAVAPLVVATVDTNAGAAASIVVANVATNGFAINTFNAAGTKADFAFFFYVRTMV